MSTLGRTVFYWQRLLAWVKQRLRHDGRVEAKSPSRKPPATEKAVLDVHGTHLSGLIKPQDQEWVTQAEREQENLLTSKYNSFKPSLATVVSPRPAGPGETTSLPNPQSEGRKEEGLGSGLWTSPPRRQEDEEEAEAVRLALVETGGYQTVVKHTGSGSFIKVQLTYCMLVIVLLTVTLVLQYVLVKYLVAPMLDVTPEQGQRFVSRWDSSRNETYARSL